MTKKITISVSDQLHERMENWREKINFSKVFRDAIENLIDQKESFQNRLKGDNDMEAIVERLRKEKTKAVNDWFEIGKSDGLEFAKSADYESLKYALTWETTSELPGNVFSWDPRGDDAIGDYFGNIIDKYAGLGFDDTTYGHSMPNEFFIEWEDGWKEGVEEFWEEVKDKL